MNSPKHTISQPPNKTFPLPDVSETMHADASAGQHQRLVREASGRHVLIVHRRPGVVERIPLLTFENGVLV